MSNNQTLQTWADNYWKTIYPVGAIYQSMNTTSPASLFGGSWEKIEDSFLYGSGTKSVGATGGEETHTLTLSEIPWHSHKYQGYHYVDYGFPSSPYTNFKPTPNGEKGFSLLYSGDWNTFGDITDGSQVICMGYSHNNMPPYYAVNIWRRVS